MRFPSGSKLSVGPSERDRNLFLFPRICINPNLYGKTRLCTTSLDMEASQPQFTFPPGFSGAMRLSANQLHGQYVGCMLMQVQSMLSVILHAEQNR